MKTNKILCTLIMICVAFTHVEATRIVIDGIQYDYSTNSANRPVATLIRPVDRDNFETYVIPDAIEVEGVSYPVTRINSTAFSQCKKLKSITIGNMVSWIGGNAFVDCTSLTSIRIPANVEEIGTSSFNGCNLEYADFQSIESLCSIAFANDKANPLSCSQNLYINGKKITDLTIPDGITKIRDYAFSGCPGITSLTFPASLREIGIETFKGCTGISKLIVPDGLTQIGPSSFFGCTNITSLSLPNSLREIDHEAFEGCTGISKLVLPEGLISIGEMAFRGCISLKEISMPSSIQAIEKDCFYHINKDFSSPNDSKFIERVNFASLESLCTIQFGNQYSNPLRYSQKLLINGEEITDLVIPEGVTCIDDYAFENCTMLKSVKFPGSMKEIKRSFTGCTGLERAEFASVENLCGMSFLENPLEYAHNLYIGGKEVTDLYIPEGVEIVNPQAFRGSNITSVIMSDDVKIVKFDSFSHCPKLKSVKFGKGIQKIEGAFSGCPEFDHVEFADLKCLWQMDYVIQNIGNPLYYGHHLYTNGEEVKEVTFPEGMKEIKESVLLGCESVERIHVPEGVEIIGASAFVSCKNLVSIDLPSTLQYIHTSSFGIQGAFDFCESLEEIRVREGNPYLDSREDCNAVIEKETNILMYGSNKTVIPHSIAGIGLNAFYGRKKLTSIFIPSSVIMFWHQSFGECSSLKDFYYDAKDLPDVKNGNPFENTPIENATLHVPEDLIEAFRTTAPWSGFGNIVALTPQTGIAINKENFPDKAFRQYLLDQDYGKDGILTQEEIVELKTIEICNIHINWTETSHSEDIPSYDIHDLKGIELLTALETLDLEYVPLTVLNLQGCKSLKQVRISECEDLSLAHILIISGLENLTSLRFDLMTQVKDLRITDCPNLKEVHIGGSTFEALTVSGCPQIEQLYCSDNRISSLNLSAMTALESLSCRNNQLTKIDISAFPNLCTLSCEDNQLVSLDVSNHAELYNLYCSGNQLTSLRAANCPILTNIQCQDNYLTGQAVEHLVEDLRQTRQTDNASLFVFDTEKSDGNFFIVEQVSRAKAKGWHVYYYGIQSIHPGQYQWYSYNGESIQYKPFLEDGKIWEVYKPAELCGYEKFWIDGDTIIEGRQYYKMFSYDLEDYRTGDVWQPYAGELINRNVRVAYLCEEDSRVYIMKDSANGKYQRYLLYDFSLGVGDKIKFWNTDYTVSDVTSVNVRGVERRKTHFDIGNNYHVDWLEGIGGFYHLLNPIPFYLPREDSLYYCGVGDKVYYQMDRLPSINDFAVNGKRWTYTSGASAYEYYLDGDTTIIENNRMYHGLKLYRKELDLETLPHYVGMIIPDSHYPDFKFNFNFKVAGGSVRSLYDFRLKEGDSGVFNGRSLTVQSITKEIFEGYEHRVFLLTDEEGNSHKWIEDIGSVTDLLQDVSLDSAEGELQSCVDHGVEIYNRDRIVPVDYTYRPFVEEGKTWVLGWYKEGADSTDPERIEYQYLQGDTIIDGLQYKRCMIDDGENMPGRYAGAVREDERVVFFCPQGTTAPLRLYDFASPAGPGGWYNEVFMDIDIIYDINFGEKFAIDTDTYKGCGREVRFNVQEKATWLQGVGNMGLYNLIMSDGFCRLLSCTVGDEVLYYDASLIPQNPEVKKKKLDFTHVIKAQPKAPRHRAQQEGIETLKGEYSDSEMFVRLNNLAGTYAVTLADATGHPAYTKEVLTDNVLALKPALSSYTPGVYTLTVENEYEKFVTTLNLTTAIASTSAPTQDKGVLFDLSGRRLEQKPQKGIYIQNGKKVLVK